MLYPFVEVGGRNFVHAQKFSKQHEQKEHCGETKYIIYSPWMTIYFLMKRIIHYPESLFGWWDMWSHGRDAEWINQFKIYPKSFIISLQNMFVANIQESSRETHWTQSNPYADNQNSPTREKGMPIQETDRYKEPREDSVTIVVNGFSSLKQEQETKKPLDTKNNVIRFHEIISKRRAFLTNFRPRQSCPGVPVGSDPIACGSSLRLLHKSLSNSMLYLKQRYWILILCNNTPFWQDLES
jgi:hypothetical protein